MVHLEDSIIINKEVATVFKAALSFEKHPQVIPTLKSIEILKQEGNKFLVERRGVRRGFLGQERPTRWKSAVEFSENQWIRAEQLEGELKGMKIESVFQAVPEGTKIVLSHDFLLPIPIIGGLISKYYVAGIVNRLARIYLEGMKKLAEQN